MNLRLSTIMAYAAMVALWPTTATSAEKNFTVVHCEQPGELTLPQEAKTNLYLKITGDIDARDFLTLRSAVISRTRELDLSEANIVAYTGRDGCGYFNSTSWMVGTPPEIKYPANTLPKYAFAEQRDNSLSRWITGSTSMRTIVLPASLEGFMESSIDYTSATTQLEVPQNATTLTKIGNAVYTKDRKTLVKVDPNFCDHLTIPESVTTVAPYAFAAAKPASVTFTSPQIPEIADNCGLTTAYIMSPYPALMAEKFPSIDCISSIATTEVEGVTPGTLLGRLGDLGLTRTEVRSVKVSGTITNSDFNDLLSLPNLHHADLSETIFDITNLSYTLRPQSSTLCELSLPATITGGELQLVLDAGCFIHGDLNLPEGTTFLQCENDGITSLTVPKSMYKISLFNSANLHSADLSRATSMQELNAFAECPRLTEISLPAIAKIAIGGALTSLTIPEGVEEFRCTTANCLISELTIPSSLKSLILSDVPLLESVDASAASSLTSMTAFYHAPMLKSIDLSNCPLTSADLFGYYISRIVSMGGTRYKPCEMKAIDNPILPSTLKSLEGFRACENLTTLSLQNCYRLERIDGISECPALERLTLPPSVTEISYIFDNPNLREIHTAALSPASVTYTESNGIDYDFSGVDLTVPNGCAGAYRMSEKWETCKSITEGGWSVAVSTSGIEELFKPITKKYPAIKGTGLYADSSTATLEASPLEGYVCKGWTINGVAYPSNPCSFTVTEHVTAIPVYEISLEDAAIEMTVQVLADTWVPMNVEASSLHVFVNGELAYSSFTGVKGTISFPVYAGSSTVTIAGTDMSIEFLPFTGGNNTSEGITSFNLRDKGSLLQLTCREFRMDNLDLSNCPNLLNFTIGETEDEGHAGSRINNLNLSDCPNLFTAIAAYTPGSHSIRSVNLDNCPKLHQAEFYNCGLEEISLQKCPWLTYLYLSSNKLTSISAPESVELYALNIINNFVTSIDVPTDKLLWLHIDDNPAAFSLLNPGLYKAIQHTQELNGVNPISFKISEEEIASGTIDLTRELNGAPEGSPTEVTWMVHWGEEPEEIEPGKYRFTGTGYYDLHMTNAAYPDVSYICYVYHEATGVNLPAIDTLSLSLTPGNVSIDGLPSASVVTLFDTTGKLLTSATASNGSATLEAPSSTIVIISISAPGHAPLTLKVLTR